MKRTSQRCDSNMFRNKHRRERYKPLFVFLMLCILLSSCDTTQRPHTGDREKRRERIMCAITLSSRHQLSPAVSVSLPVHAAPPLLLLMVIHLLIKPLWCVQFCWFSPGFSPGLVLCLCLALTNLDPLSWSAGSAKGDHRRPYIFAIPADPQLPVAFRSLSVAARKLWQCTPCRSSTFSLAATCRGMAAKDRNAGVRPWQAIAGDVPVAILTVGYRSLSPGDSHLYLDKISKDLNQTQDCTQDLPQSVSRSWHRSVPRS